MKLETDIKKIEILAQEKEESNWRFRCFLKGCDLEIEEIDAIVHRLYETVSGQIDCLKCGNCCRVIQPILLKEDISRLANSVSMSNENFIYEYLVEDEDDRGYVFKSRPCPFLSENSCLVYSDRPGDCRSYPHLHKDEFVFRVNQAFSNCSVCPIVYNVYDMLQIEIHDMNVRSYFKEYE